MTAFHHHHERHPTDTTTCHRNLAIRFLIGELPVRRPGAEHRTLVCRLSRDFVQGVADGTGCAGVAARDSPPTPPGAASPRVDP